jgi:uncharacterized membrane protein YhaH (DUF805 family)
MEGDVTNTTVERTANDSFRLVLTSLFTFRGRANRAKYWLASLIGAIALLPGFLLSDPPEGTSTAAVVVQLAVVLLATAVFVVIAILAAIRRLHDRDKSGHWVWLLLVVPVVLNVLAEVLLSQTTPRNQSLALGLRLMAFGFGFWAFVELGCLRGTQGANRFGPDPLAPT